MAIPIGLLNLAAVPWPSTELATLRAPAKTEASPCCVTFRIIWFPNSATYTVPSEATHTANGPLKVAKFPFPLTDPSVPFPARVETLEFIVKSCTITVGVADEVAVVLICVVLAAVDRKDEVVIEAICSVVAVVLKLTDADLISEVADVIIALVRRLEDDVCKVEVEVDDPA